MDKNKIQIMKDIMYNNKHRRLNIYLLHKEEKIWKDQYYLATLKE